MSIVDCLDQRRPALDFLVPIDPPASNVHEPMLFLAFRTQECTKPEMFPTLSPSACFLSTFPMIEFA